MTAEPNEKPRRFAYVPAIGGDYLQDMNVVALHEVDGEFPARMIHTRDERSPESDVDVHLFHDERAIVVTVHESDYDVVRTLIGESLNEWHDTVVAVRLRSALNDAEGAAAALELGALNIETDDSPEARVWRARIALGDLTIEDWQAHSDILRERIHQLQRWSPSHDDWHSAAEWGALIAQRIGAIMSAEDYIAPLTKVYGPSRARARDAAIEIAATAWALIAASHRGDLYESGKETIPAPVERRQSLYEVRFYYEAEDGATALSDSYAVVTYSERRALEYAAKYIAPTLPYAVKATECGSVRRAYVAHE